MLVGKRGGFVRAACARVGVDGSRGVGSGSFHEQHPRIGAERFLGDIVSERKIIHSALADFFYVNHLMRCEQLQRNSHRYVHNEHPSAHQQTFREHSLRSVWAPLKLFQERTNR